MDTCVLETQCLQHLSRFARHSYPAWNRKLGSTGLWIEINFFARNSSLPHSILVKTTEFNALVVDSSTGRSWLRIQPAASVVLKAERHGGANAISILDCRSRRCAMYAAVLLPRFMARHRLLSACASSGGRRFRLFVTVLPARPRPGRADQSTGQGFYGAGPCRTVQVMRNRSRRRKNSRLWDWRHLI